MSESVSGLKCAAISAQKHCTFLQFLTLFKQYNHSDNHFIALNLYQAHLFDIN